MIIRERDVLMPFSADLRRKVFYRLFSMLAGFLQGSRKSEGQKVRRYNLPTREGRMEKKHYYEITVDSLDGLFTREECPRCERTFPTGEAPPEGGISDLNLDSEKDEGKEPGTVECPYCGLKNIQRQRSFVVI